MFSTVEFVGKKTPVVSCALIICEKVHLGGQTVWEIGSVFLLPRRLTSPSITNCLRLCTRIIVWSTPTELNFIRTSLSCPEPSSLTRVTRLSWRVSPAFVIPIALFSKWYSLSFKRNGLALLSLRFSKIMGSMPWFVPASHMTSVSIGPVWMRSSSVSKRPLLSKPGTVLMSVLIYLSSILSKGLDLHAIDRSTEEFRTRGIAILDTEKVLQVIDGTLVPDEWK